MNIKLVKTTLASAIICISNFAHAGLVVTQNDTSSDLVTNILGSGITSSNISNTGASAAFGTFTGGVSAGIGIESGIMISTGDVYDAVGPNIAASTSTSFGTAGDAELTSISGITTNDAAFLTFDFLSDGGDLFFNYVFASEEYNEYTNSQFNDVFAFFLDGENIALIPGTTTPVSINTVNAGNPVGTNASNSHLFNNNDAASGSNFDIEYDGFTNVFTAQALGLSAGLHTIKLAIADGSDTSFDSTVFLQAGSFTDGQTDPNPIPEPSTLAIFALGIFGLVSRKLKK